MHHEGIGLPAMCLCQSDPKYVGRCQDSALARQARRVNRKTLDNLNHESMNPLVVKELILPSFEDEPWNLPTAVPKSAAYHFEFQKAGIPYVPSADASQNIAQLRNLYYTACEDHKLTIVKEAGRNLSNIAHQNPEIVSLLEHQKSLAIQIDHMKEANVQTQRKLVDSLTSQGANERNVTREEIEETQKAHKERTLLLSHERSKVSDTLAEHYRALLSQHREEGFGLNEGISTSDDSSPHVVKRLHDVSRFFPASWMKATNTNTLHAVEINLRERASFSPSWMESERQLLSSPSARSDDSGSLDQQGSLKMSSREGQDLIRLPGALITPELEAKSRSMYIHEYMHRVEEHVPEVTKLESQFLESRRQVISSTGRKEPLVSIIRNGKQSESQELAHTDSFRNIYSGRVYPRHEKGRTRYELMSTASEAIFCGDRQYFELGDSHQSSPDREFRDFALGVLLLAHRPR